jgi:uncharacterized small protein (DUF1192 family)
MNAAILLAALAALQSSPKRFIEFAEDLKRPGVAVVLGTLSRITEGHRDRLKDQDVDLGEGEAKVSISGVVYYKVDSTARLVATESFRAPAKVERGDRLNVAFDLQVATLPDGSKRRHFMVQPRSVAEDSQTGLWVLEKSQAKDEYRVLRVMRLDPKESKASDLDAFQKRAADVYEINQRVRDLTDALNRAFELREKGDPRQAAQALKPLLDPKKTWRAVESDALATQFLGPLEKRARELLAELEKKS